VSIAARALRAIELNNLGENFQKEDQSDSFANHFASLIPPGTDKKSVKNFVKIKIENLWHGNPLSCVKTFGTRGCKLCSKERMAILNLTRKTPQMAINKCNEVYGACRHRPRFHRFSQSQSESDANASTDESVKDERVPRPSSTKSTQSNDSANSLFSIKETRESEILTPHSNSEVNNFGYITNRSNGLAARSVMERNERLVAFPDPHLPMIETLTLEPKDNDGDLLLGEHFVDV